MLNHIIQSLYKSECYLVPAAVSSVASLRTHIGAHHRRRRRGDGDVRHGRWDLCRHSRAVISFAQLLWIFIPTERKS